MSETEPTTTIDARYSSPGADPTPWSTGRRALTEGEVFWIVTVRPDGRPHATPLLALWLDGAVVFTTGERERKARNLEQQAGCLLLTCDRSGANGLMVSVEGAAERITDKAQLAGVVEAYVAKYGEDWRYEVVDDALAHHVPPSEGDQTDRVLAFRLRPATGFAFGTDDLFSQTRWSFERS